MAALSIAGDDAALQEVNVEPLGSPWQAYCIWAGAVRGACLATAASPAPTRSASSVSSRICENWKSPTASSPRCSRGVLFKPGHSTAEDLPRLETRIADNRFRRCAEGDPRAATARSLDRRAPARRHADGLLHRSLRRHDDHYACVAGRISWQGGASLMLGDDPLLVAIGDLGEVDVRGQGDMLQARGARAGAAISSLEGTVAL
jgi:hypothetical protein